MTAKTATEQEALRRFLALARSVERNRTKILNLLATLQTSNGDDWRTLCRVRDLLDEITEPREYGRDL
ncbi:hypothetical protein ABZ470_23830 [Streptosporangium sp. NPDC020072]|uniref:hypothetical protein n=1 Tax=Streptosporangium sp. NPDC020072 TaxID=3154788 RepID=UPI00343EDBF0